MSKLRDKIWITSKARMISEQRYRLYDITAHLFLSYMSLLMILATVFSDDLSRTVPSFGKLMIIIPLMLFATSLIIYGFKFGDSAHNYRECYLRLQALEETFEKQSDPEGEYEKILKQCPNHAERDFEEVILKRTLFTKQEIGVGDTKIGWTAWMLGKWVIRRVCFWALVFRPECS